MYDDYDRLITFFSVHHAIRAEKLLAGAAIPAVPVPTPREVDISCGESLLFYGRDEAALLALLAGGKTRWAKLFRRGPAGRIYELIGTGEGR